MIYQTEIQQAIDAFTNTLEFAKNTDKIQSLNSYAIKMCTDYGICHFIIHKLEVSVWERDNILYHIKLEHNVWLCYDTISNYYPSIFNLWLKEPNNWREIAIDLCQQRIDYLKKFLSNGQE